jgi:phage baseplate assembly protein W
VAEARQFLTDIRLQLRQQAWRPVYTVATDQRRVPTREGAALLTDLGTVSGRDNLGQAILMRLLTPRGELAALGHPEYGSRLHELIGRPNSETTRNLARLHILEALHEERRVARVVELRVEPPPDGRQRDRVSIRLSVLPAGETRVLDLGPFSLEL